MSSAVDRREPKVVQRTIATAGLASSSASTVYYTTLVIYAVSVGLLTAPLLGLVMTVGALLAPITSMWVGERCDQDGARRWVAVSYASKASALALLVGAPTFLEGASASIVFSIALVLTSVAEHAVIVSQGALIGVVLKGAVRQRFSAQMRALLNAGYLIGALLGAMAVAVGIANSFPIVGAIAAFVSLACGISFLLLVPDAREENGESAKPLKDLRYFSLALFSGILATADAVLTVGVPIVLVTVAASAGGIFPILMAVNAVLVVVFQVRVAGRVDSRERAAAAMRLSGIASAAACIVLGLSVALIENAVLSVSLAVLATLIFVISEMTNAGGTWWLRYNARAAMAQGAYGASFSLGSATGSFLGPVIVGAIATASFGYFAFAAVFVMCAALASVVVKWGVDAPRIRS